MGRNAGLTVHEFHALLLLLLLYTYDAGEGQISLHSAMNHVRRFPHVDGAGKHEILETWAEHLTYLFKALSKLASTSGFVYRGVVREAFSDYAFYIGRLVHFSGITSTTSSRPQAEPSRGGPDGRMLRMRIF